jgi:hypothetical protein
VGGCIKQKAPLWLLLVASVTPAWADLLDISAGPNFKEFTKLGW